MEEDYCFQTLSPLVASLFLDGQQHSMKAEKNRHMDNAQEVLLDKRRSKAEVHWHLAQGKGVEGKRIPSMVPPTVDNKEGAVDELVVVRFDPHWPCHLRCQGNQHLLLLDFWK